MPKIIYNKIFVIYIMSLDTVSNVSLFDRCICCNFNDISFFGNFNTMFKGMDLKLLETKFDETDKTVIKLIANQNFLYRVADSFKQATQNYNNLKKYYFMFDAYPLKSKKLYNSTQIFRFNNAFLRNRIIWDKKFYYETNAIYTNNKNKYLKVKLQDIDILYLTYFYDANLYIKLYEAIGYARNNLGKLKNFYFKYKVPRKIFNNPTLKDKIYCGEDLIKLFIFASNKSYLLQYYKNWELPKPVNLKKKENTGKQCCLYSTGIPTYNYI